MDEFNTFLHSIELFQGFEPDELEAIAQYFEEVKLKKGATIITQGQPPVGLYIILEGEMQAIARLPDDRTYPVAKLSRGHFFGDISLIRGGAATLSIKALKTSRCYLLSNHIFNGIQILKPFLAYKLVVAICFQVCRRINNGVEQLAGNLDDITRGLTRKPAKIKPIALSKELLEKEELHFSFLKNLNPFHRMTEEQFNALIDYMSLVFLKKGDQFSAKDTAYYLIVQGAVEMTVEKGKKIGKLGVISLGNVVIPCYSPILYSKREPLLLNYLACEDCILFRIDLDQKNKFFKTDFTNYYNWHLAVSCSLVNILHFVNKQLVRYQSQRG